jgi:hypothetical protein
MPKAKELRHVIYVTNPKTMKAMLRKAWKDGMNAENVLRCSNSEDWKKQMEADVRRIFKDRPK